MGVSLKKIKSIIKERIGLDASTIGDTTLEKIIQQRMKQCHIEAFDTYLTLINNNATELGELLETAVIPETWFFRDIRPFEIIYKKIRRRTGQNSNSSCKILCLPSSTGEEPCSLVMYLLDKGIAKSAFEVDGADISSRALSSAESGIYGRNSFRGKHYATYQKKYFSNHGDTYKIDSSITDKISFYKLNILHSNQKLKNKFDFILCRNLLIYFDTATKGIAFQGLSSILKNDGYLFIGHSEFGSVPGDIFYNTGFEQAFGLVKPEHSEHNNTHNNNPVPQTIPEPVKPNRSTNFETLIKKKQINDINATEKTRTLEDARQLANSNRLREAESLCHQFIDNQGESAEAFFLLGLIADSQKKKSAAESLYRKGIFLEPENHELLIHLSLLLQAKGDHKNAALFRKRADKELKRQATK